MVFGPRPGTERSSTSPAGMVFLASSYAAIEPVARYSSILAAVPFPMPAMSVSAPDAASSATSVGRSLTMRATLR